MSEKLFAAFALMLVLEGVLPFLAPEMWRNVFRQVIAMNDGQIRFVGLTSMALGVLLLFVFA